MAKDLQRAPDGTVTRYPVVDRRRGVRFAAMGSSPTGRNVADGQIVYVLPDQINIGGPIDAGHAGMWQPNGMGGGGDATVDWEDRYRTKGPREFRP